jgi:O-antigen/teichoic acid export membrane protein
LVSDFFRKNALIGFAEILGRVPLIFTAGYLARSVGPEMFGIWALVLVYQGLSAGIAGLGLSSSISRISSVSDADGARGYLFFAVKVTSLALVGICLVTFLFKSSLSSVLGLPTGAEALLMIGLLIAVAGTWEGLLDAYFKAREQIARQMLLVAGRTSAEIIAVVAVFVLYAGTGETDAGVLLMAYASVGFAVRTLVYPWLALYKVSGMTHPGKLERSAFLRYGLPMVPAVLVAWILGQGDRLILGQMVSKPELGVYAFGAMLASYLVYLGYAVYPLLLPRASRLYEAGDRDALRSLFQNSQAVFLILFMGAMGTIALFSREIVILTAGEQFISSAKVFVVLALAVGTDQLLGIYQYVFHLVKKTSWILWLNVSNAFLLVTAVYLAAKFGGIGAVPWAVFAAVIVFNVLRYIVSLSQCPLPLRLGTVLTLTLGILLSLGLASGSDEWTLVTRAVIFIVSAVAVIIALLTVPATRNLLAAAGGRVA